MNKTEAIAFLEERGFKFKNKKRKEISVCDPGRDDWYVATTADIVAVAESYQPKVDVVPQIDLVSILEDVATELEATDTPPQPIQEQPTVSIMERDTKAIADAIESMCRILCMVAVFCYVSGYTLGTWVHEANRWIVALHKRTCEERLRIVAGYIVDGIVSTYASVAGVMA